MQMVLRRTSNFTERLSALLKKNTQRNDAFIGEWIPNRSGHMRFRALVFRSDSEWIYQIESCTGWLGSESYQFDSHACADNTFPQRHEAIKVAQLLAKQLATLRYRFQ
ncbi:MULTISPECIES: hypothetical protein [Pectobacterium]|uniref:Uncharacterized protein n=2 Tax=Pectobacterium TaxID=122277 RepID=A0AAW3SXD6_9GAMM|nr:MULTISPECIES: hypothetical protein [Pectobacterium]MBA5204735.1 hypothetical protein [Pectobacterium aroidearum]MBN3176405.1 hypothetical protein [Pectobacterium parmentieri]MBQ4791960.1 hypothetical protein [Pectobacterium versatile]QHQ23403.1 hypothetical protein GMX10_04420 [Pectobacterium parvum]QRN28924.1 hypothetical protein IG623_16545 [Pectobacterium parmentieri]